MTGSFVSCNRALLSALGMGSTHGRLSSNAKRKFAQVAGLLPWLLRALRCSRHASPTAIEFGCGKAYLGFFLAQVIRDERETCRYPRCGSERGPNRTVPPGPRSPRLA